MTTIQVNGVPVRVYGEGELREHRHCIGCGCAKDAGLVCCWSCFKYKSPVAGVDPLKYCGLGIGEWQLELYKAKVRNWELVEPWSPESGAEGPMDRGLFGEY